MASIWSWSRTAGSNATADANINWAEGQAANTVNNSSRQEMARHAEFLADLGCTPAATGTNTLVVSTYAAFSALADGLVFGFTAQNDNTASVTIAPNSLTAKKIRKVTGNGEEDLAAGDIQAGGRYLVVYYAAGDSASGCWILINVAPPAISTYGKTLVDDTDAATARTTLGLVIGTDVQAYRAELVKVHLTGSNIASASSIDIGAATGDFIGITGTTTINSLGTVAAGTERWLVFAAALTLTHNASSLILPAGGSNITTAADDVACFKSLGSGNWRCVLYTRASGAAVGSLGTMSTQNANNVTISGGSITGITDLAVADGGTGASDAATARTNLGLGTIATQAASSVTISGGSITGITDLAVADGGTGASTAANARTNLGLGTIATQDASNVTISGGAVTGITDITVADGGTGASTAANARTNLGVVIGTDVQAYRAELVKVNLQGSNIASSGSIDIGAGTGDYINITGTTTITALGTAAAGIERKLVFAAALTFTHNATSLILPGGANITTAAGDTAVMVSEGSGNWRCIDYMRAAGAPAGYSEGTWSPTMSFATVGTSSWSHATQDGAYVRIGNLVYFDLTISATPTIGTGSGALRISLPFTVAANTGACVSTMDSDFATWGTTNTSISAMPTTGVAYLTLRANKAAAGPTNISASDMTSGAAHTVTIGGCFRV